MLFECELIMAISYHFFPGGSMMEMSGTDVHFALFNTVEGERDTEANRQRQNP